MNRKILLATICITLSGIPTARPAEVTLDVTKRYLNLPVSHLEEGGRMTLTVDGEPRRSFVLRLTADDYADYWVFCDMEEFMGKTVTITYDGDPAGLAKIYQDDGIHDQESLYRELLRPGYHFTARRGWINDQNGLVWHDGEYHLFFQHNPFEREWENMHWGHAVSRDLIHWEELPEALYPDDLGTMFSGSAVIDHNNTAGYNCGGEPAMIAFYTAASDQRQVQCMAYSLDKGRTWTKYEGNPVIDSKEKWNSRDTRDPKVFRYEPAGHWVLLLNERDGHSIYISTDLKNWSYQSHITGFWECPELFELPVDGDPNNTMWVMYGASGTYMLGDFDGRVFTPLHGKYYYTSGALYAAQTFSNIPAEDGRRIQIGWGRIDHSGMPFNGLMLLPTELTLRTTKEGPRLYSVPVRETERLLESLGQWEDLTAAEANEVMRPYYAADRLVIRARIELSHATGAGLALEGQNIIDYDLNSNTLGGMFYSPQDMTSMELSAEIYIDRTSIEVFVDGGVYSYSMERNPRWDAPQGYIFWGNDIRIKELEVYTVDTIWE
ncbi:MAG: glycoside hydrolase family 32 protein [Rikenellaceae bacterium]|nr:glycoside hydrolase family 32 protein [Rikenellaceae bacterium]